MPSVFLVSDTHFGHAGVCRFTHPDDPEVKLRPWTDPDEMDEEMVRRWNDCVRPSDKVYHLGDVVIKIFWSIEVYLFYSYIFGDIAI